MPSAPPPRDDDPRALSTPALPPAERPDAPPRDALRRAYRALLLALAAPAEQERVRWTVLRSAAELFAADAALLCLPAPELNALRVHAAMGALGEQEGELLPTEGSLEGAALRARHPLLTPDLLADPRGYRSRERGIPSVPAIVLPLLAAGEVLGVVLIARSGGAASFLEADVALAASFAEAAASALANARTHAANRHPEAELVSWRERRALEQSRERYRRAAECQRAAVLEFWPENGEMVWEGSTELLFGVPSASFAPTLTAWQERLHPEDRTAAREALRTAAEGGEARVECRVLLPGGDFRDAVLRCCRAPASVVGTLTEAVAGTSTRWHERKGRLEAARELVRALRHEINNPLAIVMGEAQLLRDEALGALPPGLRHSVIAIGDAGERIQRVVQRLSALEEAPRDSYSTELGGIDFPPG